MSPSIPHSSPSLRHLEREIVTAAVLWLMLGGVMVVVANVWAATVV